MPTPARYADRFSENDPHALIATPAKMSTMPMVIDAVIWDSSVGIGPAIEPGAATRCSPRRSGVRNGAQWMTTPTMTRTAPDQKTPGTPRPGIVHFDGPAGG